MSTKRTYTQKARAEKAAETRRRITEATVALHEEVGPARTSVAEIARRAGVQRLTVYNHFPTERELIGACQAHWLKEHPQPDLGPLFALADPADRLRAVTAALYGWYRATESMSAKILRDAEVMPVLGEMLGEVAEQQEALIDALAAGFGARGARARRVRAAAALAVDFWAWRTLARSGLSDDEAAEVAVGGVVAAATPAARR